MPEDIIKFRDENTLEMIEGDSIKEKIAELCDIMVSFKDVNVLVTPLTALARTSDPDATLQEIPTALYQISNLKAEMEALVISLELDFNQWQATQYELTRKAKIAKDAKAPTETAIKREIENSPEWFEKRLTINDARLVCDKLKNAINSLNKKFEALKIRSYSNSDREVAVSLKKMLNTYKDD